jgi:hypothetical protein
VFRDPGEDRYRRHFRAAATDAVWPQAWPDLEIEGSALLPKV